MLGLILAGGESARMGQNKSTMNIDGFSMLAIATHSLRDCAMIVIAAGDNEVPEDSVMFHQITDSKEHVGPRAGLLSGLMFALENDFELVQLSPCDTPLVESGLFKELKDRLNGADCCVPITERGIHPLHALVRTRIFLDALIQDGDNSNIHSLVSSLSHNMVEVDEEMMLNVNTPEDLAEIN